MKRLNSCIEGKKYDGFPVWFMRQAGRYLPEFRKIRKKNQDFGSCGQWLGRNL